MSEFRIIIKTDNAAFEGDPHPEVARLLRQAADELGDGNQAGKLWDYNGNPVGGYSFRTDDLMP